MKMALSVAVGILLAALILAAGMYVIDTPNRRRAAAAAEGKREGERMVWNRSATRSRSVYLLTPLKNPPRCAVSAMTVTPSSSIGMR